MEIISYILIGLLGAIIGSFLNVVLFRFGSGQGLNGRSVCGSCGKILSWVELVPVVSFLIQKRRCRGCASAISWQYPVVEVSTAILFVLTFWRLSSEVELFSVWSSLFSLLMILGYLVGMSFLILIAVYDFHHKLIPDEWVIGLGGTGIFLSFVTTPSFGSIVFSLMNKGLAALILGFFFWAIWYYSKGKAMGFGDVKLALALGLFLGLDQGLVGVILAFWLGAIVGLGLIWGSKIKLPNWPKISSMKSELPFAPFLVTGSILAFVLDLKILDWFLI